MKLRVKFEDAPGENPGVPQYLEPGWFRLNAADTDGVQLTDELKRIYVHKFDIMPPDESGEQSITVIFRIVDNPIWFPAILLALGGIAGGVISYSVVEDVGTFSDEVGNLSRSIGVAAAVVAIVSFVISSN